MPVIVMFLGAFLFILSTPSEVAASTITSSVTGWLAPDSSHLSNSMLVIMLPLAGLGFFVWIGRSFKMKGDAGVYWALSGLTVGSFVADLPASGTNTLAVPFADGVVSAVLLFLWWWNS